MTDSKTEIEELKTLQREAEELRAEREKAASEEPASAEAPAESAAPREPGAKRSQRRRTRPASRSAARQKSEPTPEQDSTQEPTSGELAPEAGDGGDDAIQLDNLVREMENAARERPVLALLAAFTVGILVGQLFSRR